MTGIETPTRAPAAISADDTIVPFEVAALDLRGRVSKERKVHEQQRWFRRGFRYRAGIEGRIRVLKRDFGLGRCVDHGAEGMERWVGWGIVTANLAKIAETQAARQAKAAA